MQSFRTKNNQFFNSVCQFECLNPIKVKMAEPTGPFFWCIYLHEPGKGYGLQEFKTKLCLETSISTFLKNPSNKSE